MRLAAIDPSSTRIGAAVFDGESCERWAVVKVDGVNEAKVMALRQAAADLIGWLLDGGTPIEVFIVEIPAPQAPCGKIGSRGQATYGMAVGYVLAQLEFSWPLSTVITVPSDEWTHGVSKARRAKKAAVLMPSWSIEQDRGMDAADAIALGAWWHRHQLVAEQAARITGKVKVGGGR